MAAKRINIKGEPYVLQIGAVMDRHSDGTPKTIRVLKENEDVNLSENPHENWFVTFYVKLTTITNPPPFTKD